jgi:pectate lyase
MKNSRPFTKGLLFLLLLTFSATQLSAQTILFDYHFTDNALPAGITSSGVINPTKAADGVCSKGMIQVNSGGYIQVELSSCNVMTVNMKSTSTSTRLLTVKYKKDGEATFTTVSTTLAVSIAASYNLTTLYPAMVSSVPVIIRIEPTNGNIQVHDLYAAAATVQSDAAEITAFKVPGQIGSEVINSIAGTININVPLGTSLVSIIPQTITISAQATISPSIDFAQNFSSPVIYTVTAQNGTTVKPWTITITPVASAEKEITVFKLSNQQLGEAVINSTAGTISVMMPIGASLNGIAPVTLTVSANASIDPGMASTADFSVPVVYTVTAQDNSTKTWTVTTTVVDPNATYFGFEAEDAEFTGTAAKNHAGYSGTGFIDFLEGGENFISFTVCQLQAGAQTAKFRYSLANDTQRKGKLYVNDVFVKLLDFPRTSTFDDWSEEIAPVNLQGGINKLRIIWDSTDAPNLDKMLLTGASCNSFTINVSATNGGTFSMTPVRKNNKYFEGEIVTLLANSLPALVFDNWTGDLTGNANPATITADDNKTIVANFTIVPTYKLIANVSGIGAVTLSPAGGEYAAGTIVTLTANTVLGSSFTGWGGDASGTEVSTMLIMNSVKNVTASFTSSYTLNFETVKGFASISADGFTGPTTGGQCAIDTVFINGPSEFNKLCETLYNRQQAYKNNTIVNGIKKAPLVILLKAGIYDGTQTLSTNGAKAFANFMLDIPEQADLTLLGESNVVFKIGINVKRSVNVLLRNIFFQDYYDDGVNIGGELTHHIWVDHCTFGNAAGMPADSEHPDGGCDVKDGASYVTISWCTFRNNWKTSLVGHSDNNGAIDKGRLKVTYINNHFIGNNSRNPRVRFGEVHFVNNLVQDVNLYGSVAANSAYLFSENNFFLNTDWPMYADRASADFKAVFGNNTDGVYTSKTGNYPAAGLKQSGNEYDDSGLPLITAQINPAMLNPGGRSIRFDEFNPAAVFDPASYYAYTPFTAAEVRVIIPIYAGADKVQYSTAGCSPLLPVQLLTFNVTHGTVAKTAAITWSTTNEINARNFEVQKSINAKDFVVIGDLVAAKTTGINSYNFTDTKLVAGITYYRLKQIDRDGKFTYSRTLSITVKDNNRLDIFPNPATSMIQVAHAKATAGSQIKIVTVEGKVLLVVKASQGTTRTIVTTSKIAAGSYLVVYTNGTDEAVSRFVRQ